MTSRAGDSYSYNRAGNLDSAVVGATGWKYIYDALDRLIAVRQNGVTLARYAYDVLGRRVVKRVYSGANTGYVRMVYAGTAVAVEADSVGNLTLGYTVGLGIDNLVAVHKYADATDFYVIQDALHSVRGLSRRDGVWIASWRYGIYGAVIDSTNGAPFVLRYRWTGREYDLETGFYYFRARYYDPAVMRFVQEDPAGYAGGGNLYAYGEGNPTNGRDPEGLRKDYEAMANLAGYRPVNDAAFDCWASHCGGGGGGWQRGEAWGAWEDLGGSIGFGWANLTQAERSYTGSLRFNSNAAFEAYMSLKQRAYESGLTVLQDLLRQAENGRAITINVQSVQQGAPPGCGAACSTRNGNIYIDPNYESIRDRPIGLAVAHELGHLIPVGIGFPMTPVPPSFDPTEPSAFWWEYLASIAYGCLARGWNHALPPRRCYST